MLRLCIIYPILNELENLNIRKNKKHKIKFEAFNFFNFLTIN